MLRITYALVRKITRSNYKVTKIEHGYTPCFFINKTLTKSQLKSILKSLYNTNFYCTFAL
nr:MAG TPA: hypothetical protein [Caudoviricetes sp.]